MTWKNAIKDGKPSDNGEVIVCVNGVNYRAKYSAAENGFVLEEDQTFVCIQEGTSIYWTEIESVPALHI